MSLNPPSRFSILNHQGLKDWGAGKTSTAFQQHWHTQASVCGGGFLSAAQSYGVVMLDNGLLHSRKSMASWGGKTICKYWRNISRHQLKINVQLGCKLFFQQDNNPKTTKMSDRQCGNSIETTSNWQFVNGTEKEYTSFNKHSARQNGSCISLGSSLSCSVFI